MKDDLSIKKFTLKKTQKRKIMKKITLIAIASIAISTISCEKHYYCECYSAGHYKGVYNVTASSNSDATGKCKSFETQDYICTIK